MKAVSQRRSPGTHSAGGAEPASRRNHPSLAAPHFLTSGPHRASHRRIRHAGQENYAEAKTQLHTDERQLQQEIHCSVGDRRRWTWCLSDSHTSASAHRIVGCSMGDVSEDLSRLPEGTGSGVEVQRWQAGPARRRLSGAPPIPAAGGGARDNAAGRRLRGAQARSPGRSRRKRDGNPPS